MREFSVKTIFSIGILISFFLPWIDIGIYRLNAIEITTQLHKLITLDRLFKLESGATYLQLSYILYLIPLLAIINIILDLTKSKFEMWINEFWVAFVMILLLFAFIGGVNENSISVISIGTYLTIIFSILGIFSPLMISDKEVLLIHNKQSIRKDISVVDKSNLLNQLSQLHSLREKNVITEEIYEKERQIILIQLQPNGTTNGGNESLEEKEIPIDTQHHQKKNNLTTNNVELFDGELINKKDNKWNRISLNVSIVVCLIPVFVLLLLFLVYLSFRSS